MKKYVSELVGAEYVIPIVGGPWFNPEDIDFDILPRQFVLKCNHDCGSVIICEDKNTFDFAAAKRKLGMAIKQNYYLEGREWPYKNVEPCIFAEQFMVDESGKELKDYKWICFNGIPKSLFIITGRYSGDMRLDWFDDKFKKLPFERGYPNSNITYGKPKAFEEMKELAQRLSQGIPFVRVDFYNVNGHLYVGEFTFFPGGGVEVFKPKEWDSIFGSWLDLSTVKKIQGD